MNPMISNAGATMPALTNPMAQINDPRAEQLKQMMLILGGLGPSVPYQPPGQATSPTLGPTNPMQTPFRGF